MCTGHSATFLEEEALDVGIKRYLLKPVVDFELLRAVREVFDEKRRWSGIDSGGKRTVFMGGGQFIKTRIHRLLTTFILILVSEKSLSHYMLI